MRSRLAWAGAAALALTLASPTETKAVYTNFNGTIITNGVILITTRSGSDNYWFQPYSSSPIWDGDDPRGPGSIAPGDAAMMELLQDNGYSVHMLPEKALTYVAQGGGITFNHYGSPNDPTVYYNGQQGPSSPGGTSEALSPMLVIMSGSGSSADMIPPNTNGIPIMVGEHSCLGDSGNTAGPVGGHSEIFLYHNKSGNSANLGASAGQYMKVLLPNHPIMQGIPLDAQGRVKIIRDPYPDENASVQPPIGGSGGGLNNYVPSWTTVNITNGAAVPADTLQIIGVLDSDTNRAVFATLERGASFSPCTTSDPDSNWNGYSVAPSRLVHFFVNENGSGNSKRAFNNLTIWGRIIFLRTCKWAMEENLPAFQNFGIIDVGQVSPGLIKLGWTGSIHNLYRIDGTTDFVNWLPIADSITNNGEGVRVTRTLNIASAPQAVYMRVASLP